MKFRDVPPPVGQKEKLCRRNRAKLSTRNSLTLIISTSCETWVSLEKKKKTDASYSERKFLPSNHLILSNDLGGEIKKL